MTRSFVLSLCLVGVGVGIAGCSDIETTPAETVENAEPVPSDIDQAAVQEPFVPGDGWYDYDGRTRVVTPTDEIYLLIGQSTTHLLAITSYYDERGESGTFSYDVRSWDGESWSAIRSGEPAGNVKDGPPVCASLDTATVVACESDTWDVVFRIDARIVPYGGFAVNNPAIHPRGHHWEPDRAFTVYRLRGLALEEVTESPDTLAAAFAASPNADASTDAGRLHGVLRGTDDLADVFLQATNDLYVAQWRAVVEEDALRIDTRCVDLSSEFAEQTPLTNSEPRTFSIALDSTAQEGVLIDLCSDDPTVQRYTEALDGLWPDTRAFDLVVETSVDGPMVRLAPGSLALRVKLNGSDPAEPMAPTELDERLWAE